MRPIGVNRACRRPLAADDFARKRAPTGTGASVHNGRLRPSGDAAQVEDELGDLLFVAVNLARQLKVDPAAALCRANAKFERRFRALERLAGNRERLGMMALDEMEALWQQVKTAEDPAA